jgi:hypothetical protein
MTSGTMESNSAKPDALPASARLNQQSPRDVGTKFNGLLGGAIFVATFGVFFLEHSAIAAVNGWWFDELFSIWSSNPAEPFSAIFLGRIEPDTTPPLYGSLLYWARTLIKDDRQAIFVLNTSAILIAAIAVIFSGRKAGFSRLAVATSIAFLLSGPVLRFVSEARPYAPAMALAFVTSWFSALAILVPRARPGPTSFALLGTVAGLTHIYAALLCGSFAAALVLLAVIWRRSDLMASGLSLGFSATLVLSIWLALWLPFHSLENLYWMKLSYATVVSALWEAKQLAIGPHLLIALIALLAFGVLWPTTRMLTSAFLVAFSIFLFLPLLISLKQPIILGRYWLQGTPAIIVLIALLARTWLFDGISSRRWHPVPIAGAFAAVAFLTISDATGFIIARAFTAAKPIWKGALVVAPLARDCPTASVHVNGFIPLFAYTSQIPDPVFADAREPATDPIKPADSKCPVLGWAEEPHPADFMHRATDEDLLRLLKVGASPSQVEILRHPTGFVILRRAR